MLRRLKVASLCNQRIVAFRQEPVDENGESGQGDRDGKARAERALDLAVGVEIHVASVGCCVFGHPEAKPASRTGQR